MAFMQHWKCTNCGTEQWAETCPEEWDCPCYEDEAFKQVTLVEEPS